MERREFQYKGAKLVYHTTGTGPLVVLLHGFGEDSSVWKNQFNLFPNHQLIVPDLPGSGESELIDGMSMEGMAEAVKEIISALGKRGAILIGHSMGGYITLAIAEKYPEAVNAFGLFHSTAFADSEERKEKRRKAIEAIKNDGPQEFLKTFIPTLYAPDASGERAKWIDKHMAQERNANGGTLVSYHEAMMERPDRTAVLRESKVPVLFVMGKHDTAIPLEDGLKQCHLPQTAYIHLLQHSGHMGMVEEAAETNKILAHFVKTVKNIA